jgi:hypothetical protein
MPTLTSPNRLITDWLTEQSEIIPIEKSIEGKVTINDIQGTLREYQGLFKAGYASPAMILTLYRAYPDSTLYKEVVEERGLLKEDPMVVGGPASVEMIDHEGHLITAAALSKAYDKYMENPMTRNVMVMHSDIQVGWALPAYISRSGEVFKGGMNDKTLFFISELRKDTKISKKVTEQITKSKMRSYSIAGSAIKTANVAGNLLKGESPYMRVDELELAEVTICEKGVNQGAGFDLIKSHNHATKSCADGSCLITKSPDVKPLQTTETLTFADYKDLLNNDNKDTKSFVQMFKEYTDMNISKGRSKELQDKGLGERVKDTDIGGDYEPNSQTAANYAHRIATGNESYGSVDSPRSKKAQTAIERGGVKGAARHGGRRALAEDWTPSMQEHHWREESKVGERAAELGRENTYPYKKVKKAVWEAFGMDVEKANMEQRWGQPSSADKPNTQARKKGLIRGLKGKKGESMAEQKKRFERDQLEDEMRDEERQNRDVERDDKMGKKSSPKPHQVESDPISGQDDQEFQQKEFDMNDTLMIQKGLTALLEEGHDEYMLIKGDILDNDLDLAFDTFEDFELRLEAFEAGEFDPDIEKVLGIGGRKAGTWNPLGRKAKMNRAEGREKEKNTQADYEADEKSRGRGPGKKGPSAVNMKGRQPGGKARGAGGGYKGGDLSDRDTFAGALARRVVGAKNKASKLRPSDPRRAIGKKVGQGRDAASAAGSAAVSGAKAAGNAAASGAKTVGSTTAGVGAGVGRVGAAAGKGVVGAASETAKNTKAAYTGNPRTSRSTNVTPASRPGSIANQGGVAGAGNKDKTHSGGYLGKADLDAIWEAFEDAGLDIEKAGK